MRGVRSEGVGERLFSDGEMHRRRAAIGAVLEDAGVPYALVYGANRSGSAVSWLTDWPVTREALLVLGPDAADDVLLVSFYNHLPQARRLARTRTEWAGERTVTTAVRFIEDRVGRLERVGVVGQIPFDQYRVLAGWAGSVVDLNPAYTTLRLIKSDEEITALRRAAALTDAAVAALVDNVRIGISEHELLARLELAYAARGGMRHIGYLATTSMGDPSVCVPGQWPTARGVRAGDVVLTEISAAVAPEYAGQLLRTCTVAAEPTSLYAEMHAVAMAAFEAVSGRLVPGTVSSDLAAAGSLIEESGFTMVDDLVHGFGGGYLPPVIGGSTRRLAPSPDLVLAAGMTVVVQPNVVTPDGRAGVQTGELLLVTDNGAERLHAFPPGLQVLG
jgi:Xaa-Pro aminopeptidase